MKPPVLTKTLEDKLSDISDFLENLEAIMEDYNASKKLREFMTEQDLWKIPTPAQNTTEIPKEPEVPEQIVYNAVKCLDCGTTIVSRTTHDYKTCGCSNEAMVDGGLSYARYGAKDMDKITKITYTTEDPFDLIREFMAWGTYGKNGDQPLRYINLKDMTDAHIRAVLLYKYTKPWVIKLLKQELDYRTEFNISITE